jgi:hypothetical protein
MHFSFNPAAAATSLMFSSRNKSDHWGGLVTLLDD